MSGFYNKMVVQISYWLVSLVWFSTIIALVSVPIFSFLVVKSELGFLNPTLSFPIDTEVILFTPEQSSSFIEVSSSIASADLKYVADNYPKAFFKIITLSMIVMLITLYGITLLRSILSNLRKNIIFDNSNTLAIKRIAIAIVALSPMEWIYRIILEGPFSAYLKEHQVTINIGSADFGFLTIGFLIFTLGLIFERGHQLYEEQKLTV